MSAPAGVSGGLPNMLVVIVVSCLSTVGPSRPRCLVVARAFPWPEVHRGRCAIPVQRRLTYPNYAKQMPHLFA